MKTLGHSDALLMIMWLLTFSDMAFSRIFSRKSKLINSREIAAIRINLKACDRTHLTKNMSITCKHLPLSILIDILLMNVLRIHIWSICQFCPYSCELSVDNHSKHVQVVCIESRHFSWNWPRFFPLYAFLSLESLAFLALFPFAICHARIVICPHLLLIHGNLETDLHHLERFDRICPWQDVFVFLSVSWTFWIFYYKKWKQFRTT